jgi:hypothetical protein
MLHAHTHGRGRDVRVHIHVHIFFHNYFIFMYVRYHTGGSMKLNARILHLAYMVYL